MVEEESEAMQASDSIGNRLDEDVIIEGAEEE